MEEVKDSPRANVRIGYDGRVHKTYRGRLAEERFHNERRLLQHLERSGCDFVPRVLESNEDELILVMTNCGHPVKELSQKKMDTLFDELETYGVRHGDQAIRNVTYDQRRNRFCIIDFEFAQLADSEAVPSPWSRLRWSGLSECGPVRKRNDDSVAVFTVSEKGFHQLALQGEAAIQEGDVVALVSDGMGGATSGDLASSVITGRMREIIPQTYRLEANALHPDRLGLLGECFEHVHESLNYVGEKRPHLAGMGATATVCWFTPTNAYFGHVGDTRLYHFREGTLKQLTKDESRAWDAYEKGEINERQFRLHPRRHVLKQVIGAGVQKIIPQLGCVIPAPGDWFLLCSDGLIGGLWEKHLQEAFAEGSSKAAPEEMTQGLYQQALEADGSDNISLITVRVD